jgi:hypothetical protein
MRRLCAGHSRPVSKLRILPLKNTTVSRLKWPFGLAPMGRSPNFVRPDIELIAARLKRGAIDMGDGVSGRHLLPSLPFWRTAFASSSDWRIGIRTRVRHVTPYFAQIAQVAAIADKRSLKWRME